MYRLLRYLFTRFAPRVGWPIAMLLLGVAVCPSLAAAESTLPLPDSLLFWAGTGGALLGLRAGRATGQARLLFGAVAALLGVALVVAGGRALPPAGLVAGDLAALAQFAARWWWESVATPMPELLTWRFLGAALPRLWRELLAAPAAGAAGAALLVTTIAVITSWAGAVCLGWATGARRPTLGWSLPALVALGATSILGGGRGIALVIGLAMLLLLAVVTSYAAREQAWERTGAAYAEDLRWDVIGWGSLSGAIAIALALILPTRVPSSLAAMLWPSAELPSGLAEIDRRVQRERARPPAQVGVSQLPAVPLGVSLEQGPPETLALRIRTGEPLAEGPWPRYWRARVLSRYDGRSWRADARTAPFSPWPNPDDLPAGAITQTIEDLRQQREVLVALPDVLWLDLPAGAERLPDGTVAALTSGEAPSRYQAISLPQELVTPFDARISPPPDLSAYVSAPSGMPARVAELAETIAGRETNAFARAIALERYLRELPYSYEVRPLPRGGDAVDQFLFEMREGYCTYYASAMVMMARSLGIPARVAVGYATGTFDEASGAYVVREADAHAWPELLIDGRWVPFEPTPVRPLPARNPAAPAPEPTAVVVPPPPAPEPALWPRLALPAAAVVALALIVAAWFGLRARLRSPLTWAQLQIERLGAGAGVPWPVGATLQEYARLLEARAGGESRALRELVLLIEAARYGRRPLDEGRAARLRAALRELRRWLRQRVV